MTACAPTSKGNGVESMQLFAAAFGPDHENTKFPRAGAQRVRESKGESNIESKGKGMGGRKK